MGRGGQSPGEKEGEKARNQEREREREKEMNAGTFARRGCGVRRAAWNHGGCASVRARVRVRVSDTQRVS